jgi:amidohydrolase
MNKYMDLRRRLHRQPELAFGEEKTARTIVDFLQPLGPDRVVTGLGGHGLAFDFDGESAGPRVLVRCELDALPIDETTDLEYRSEFEGVSHKCGHDGHMTMVAGLAERLRERRPERGTVTLFFQPAEETGEGAARVLEDPAFKPIRPDFALALHNLPGYSLGQVVLRAGVFASASCGLSIALRGATSHAAEPQSGRSPAPAVAQLIQVLSAIPQFDTALHESAQVTVIHARIGEIAFGTSPGEAVVMATLRSHTQAVIDRLTERATELARRTAETFGLDVTIDSVQPFPATVNDEAVVELVDDAARSLKMETEYREVPFAWSEDFGHFTSNFRGALFGLGAGRDHPALHHPDYDFPDGLLKPGIDLLEAVVRQLLEREHV